MYNITNFHRNCDPRIIQNATKIKIILNPTILAIESSCDDTSIAILKEDAILCNLVASQSIHKEYGGIVPEVASRQHLLHIVPLLDQAYAKAGIRQEDVDAIAFTRGPGLLGSLIVGVSFAKSLALSLDIPMIEVNHMQAHVLAHFIDEPAPAFPFLCLTVSGGHTQIVLIESHHDMKVIGQTLDDAAGEAFDKSGKMLQLDYPAGPLIDKYAKLGQPKFSFTEPDIAGLDFSFSGLKTGILYFLRDQQKVNSDFIKDNLHDICASIQDRICTILVNKLKQAAAQTGITEIAIAGGVSANSGLRNLIEVTGAELGWNTYIPQFQYCTDNAAMIAIAAKYKFLKEEFVGLDASPQARMTI